MADLLMWVGEQHYPWPHDFSDEVKRMGLSKKIPKSAIPLIVPGRTRLALIHPKVTIELGEGHTSDELARRLGLDEGETGDEMRTADQVRRALAQLEGADAPAYEALMEAMELTYGPGIFGYVWLTGIQYVCGEDEEDAPEELRALGVEGVRIEHDD